MHWLAEPGVQGVPYTSLKRCTLLEQVPLYAITPWDPAKNLVAAHCDPAEHSSWGGKKQEAGVACVGGGSELSPRGRRACN